MKILITGASGFIGSEICNKFYNDTNYHITTAVRKLNENNNKYNQVLIKNIDKDTNWESALKNCDIVIHLASLAHVSNSKITKITKNYISTNYEGTINLFKQSIKFNIKRFIFISSIKVNGDYSENHNDFKYNDIPNPQNLYSKLKLKTENDLLIYSKQNSIELLILRPALVYGNNIKGNFLLLYEWINKSYPFLFTNYNYLKSFLSIDNFFSALLKSIEINKIDNQVLLLSDPNPITLHELLNKISIYQNKKLKYYKINSKFLYMFFYILGKKNIYNSLYLSSSIDIEKTKQILNWYPENNFDQCIKSSVKFFINYQIKNKKNV